jgi:predicted permease
MKSQLRSYLHSLFTRGQVESNIEAELRAHIELRAEDLQRTGLSSAEALRRARIEFGGLEKHKEDIRTSIGLRLFDEFRADLRYATRMLRRSPGFTAVAVASLALGIGATTAMFSLIYAAILHPFPYADADRIVNPAVTDEAHPQTPTWFALTPAQFDSFKQAKSIDRVLGFDLVSLQTTGSDLPEDVRAAYVTSNASSFFGVPALLGRGIQPSDAAQRSSQSNVLVLNYTFWKRKYDGDANVVGKILKLNHADYTIVGIMPQRFTFTETVGLADVYIPWMASSPPWLFPWIKLKPGVSLAAANAEFQSYLNQFKKETPKHFPAHFHVNVQPIATPYVHRAGSTLALLFASVVLLLIIGCANCSVLLLARGEARQHELAIRSAIGASRFRIVRQLLIESLVISFAGACIGVIASYWLAKLPLQLMPDAFPLETAITINLPILAFSIGLALATGLLFGLAPALRISRPNVSQVMQATASVIGNTASKRGLNLLIAGQIALTFVLLGAAGAAIAGFLRITTLHLGYDPHNVMAVSIPLKRDTKKDQPERAAYVSQLRDRVASVPGVLSVAVSTKGIPPAPPFSGIGTQSPFDIFGTQAKSEQLAVNLLVSPEYFATLKIPLLAGRVWDQAENRRGDFVAVINQTLAQRYWPNGDAIGHQLRVPSLKDDGKPSSAASPESGEWRQIIGVVADSKNDGLERSVAPAIYVPYTAFMWDRGLLFIRTAGSPLASLHAVRAALVSVNPDQRTETDPAVLETVLQHQPLWMQQKLFSILFSFFACLALVLSLVGIASTVSFAVSRRTNELGVRLALGAQRSHIVWIVTKTAFVTIAGGIFAGLLMNLALQKVLEHWTPASVIAPWILALVTLLLVVSAALACLLPAKRAADIDPMQTLRTQ